MTTMTHNELMENELNLVNGGAKDNEEKSLLDILEEYDFDETKDPFYVPGPYLPWDPRQYVMPGYDPYRTIDPDMLKDA